MVPSKVAKGRLSSSPHFITFLMDGWGGAGLYPLGRVLIGTGVIENEGFWVPSCLYEERAKVPLPNLDTSLHFQKDILEVTFLESIPEGVLLFVVLTKTYTLLSLPKSWRSLPKSWWFEQRPPLELSFKKVCWIWDPLHLHKGKQCIRNGHQLMKHR
jgi:hypothetical protein